MSKALVLYFSVYGTAKKTAEEIAKQTGADLMEIEPAVPYDSDHNHYNALARLAKKEVDSNARPRIKNTIPAQDYDAIFIGYPMWWYTFPMIIYTFFEQYDLSGKTIIPFNTHAGSGDGGTYQTIKEFEPGATVKDGLAISGGSAFDNSTEETVKSWLASLE